MLTVKKVSPLGYLIIAIIVAEVLIFIPSSLKDIAPTTFVAPAEDVDLSIQGFKAVNLGANGQKETIRAKQAELYQKSGFAILKEVDARLFTESDDVIHITGEKGKYNLKNKNLEIFGNIVAVSENLGYQLKTTYLKYQDQEKLLSSTESIYLSGPNPSAPSLIVKGKGFLSSPNDHRISILSETYCKKFDEGADSIEIDSDKADIFLEKNEALFKENVVVTQKDMNIFTDHFKIAFNRKNKGIDQATAFHLVKIVQGDRIATAQKAHFLNREQKIVLKGNPKVKQGADVVEAKVVVFFTAENKILFDEAVGEVYDQKFQGFGEVK